MKKLNRLNLSKNNSCNLNLTFVIIEVKSYICLFSFLRWCDLLDCFSGWWDDLFYLKWGNPLYSGHTPEAFSIHTNETKSFEGHRSIC